MKVIIHNDDFGINQSFNEAIIDCTQNGLTTSTSVRVNGTGYNSENINVLKKINIGIGLHLNLTDGKTQTHELANKNGDYKYKFVQYLMRCMGNGNNFMEFIYADLDKQFIQAIINDKLPIDHINGHDHIHMIPSIFELTCKLCKKYKIKYIRVCNEPFYITNNLTKLTKTFLNGNALKHWLLSYYMKRNIEIAKKYNLKFVDAFYGILYTDNMDTDSIKSAVKNASSKNFKVVEILLHPAYYREEKFTSQFIKEYTAKPSRVVEAEALKNRQLAKWIKKENIKLVSYSIL